MVETSQQHGLLSAARLIVLTFFAASALGQAPASFGMTPFGSEHFTPTSRQERSDKIGDHLPKGFSYGLHITRADAGIVLGSFSIGNDAIYFEVVRGEPNDASDADAPPYGLDVRIMDRHRTPFVLRTAGAAPVDPTWYADVIASERLPIDIEARQRAFGLFPKAARALRAYDAEHTEARWEIAGLLEVLEYLKVEDLYDNDSVIERGDVREDATQVMYSHKVTIKKKRSSANLPKREYEHSAILLQIYKSNGALVDWWESCNHGTCATSSLMSAKCSKTFSKPDIRYYFSDGMCELYRSVWPVQHLCNDDTRQEYLSIKNSLIKDYGVCKGFRLYAPDCD